MRKDIFQIEFNKRFKSTNLKISSTANGIDHFILNAAMSKTVLLRPAYPDYNYMMTHWKSPAPFLNGEAVLWFLFKTDDSVYPPDYMSLIYENPVLNRTDFLIVKTDKLKERLHKISGKPGKSPIYKMLLWIFRGDFLYVATNL